MNYDRERQNYALYGAMAACSEYYRERRTNGAFRLYRAAMDMWRELAR